LAAFVLIFLNILPYSKHFHIITAILNVFARNTGANKLPTITDLEGKVEREEPIGFSKITDLSWKDVLDLYTCTECGRCSDNCPAYTTEKKLSPKHVTLALRDHLLACEHTSHVKPHYSYTVERGRLSVGSRTAHIEGAGDTTTA
jgi:ferredoxin